MSKGDKILTLISIITGCIGIADVVILGMYITIFCLRVATLIPSFLTEAIIAAIAAVTSTAILLFGSILIYKGQPKNGGILNILAGAITIITYAYYTERWNFPLLVQLGPAGILLLIPATISGILGILISRLES